MEAKLLLLFLLSVTLTLEVEDETVLIDTLRSYENNLYDPIDHNQVNYNELFSVTNRGTLFPARGLAIGNHIANLSMPLQEYRKLSTRYNKLKEKYPNNPSLERANKKKVQVENILGSMCRPDDHDKRFVVTTLVVILSGIAGFLGGGGAALATVAATVGLQDKSITEESLGINEKLDDENHKLELVFEQQLKELNKKNNYLDDRVKVINEAAALETGFERIYQYLQEIKDIENYNFQYSAYLYNMGNRLTTNSEVRKLLDASKFGLHGTTTLLSLSESEPILITGNTNYKCSSSWLLSKIKTVIPSEISATPTESPYRFKIDNETSLYSNPRYIMKPSKFRHGNSFWLTIIAICSSQQMEDLMSQNPVTTLRKSFTYSKTPLYTCQSIAP